MTVLEEKQAAMRARTAQLKEDAFTDSGTSPTVTKEQRAAAQAAVKQWEKERAKRAAKNEAVLKMLAEGAHASAIEKQVGVRNVSRILVKQGRGTRQRIKAARKATLAAELAAQFAPYLQMLMSGATLKEVGQKLGVTRERVRVIANKVDPTWRERRNQIDAEQEAKVKALAKAEKETARAGRVPTSVNGKHTAEYQVYRNMLQRCYNPKNKMYPRYGGRGVVVCERWLGPDGFQHFYEDMGPRPAGIHQSGRALYSINRIDNVLLYSKETCEWATQEEQCAPGQRRTENISKNIGKWWANLSDEERKEQIAAMTAGRRAWWESLSDEERLAHSNKEWWANLSDEERNQHKATTAAGKQAGMAERKRVASVQQLPEHPAQMA